MLGFQKSMPDCSQEREIPYHHTTAENKLNNWCHFIAFIPRECFSCNVWQTSAKLATFVFGVHIPPVLSTLLVTEQSTLSGFASAMQA